MVRSSIEPFLPATIIRRKYKFKIQIRIIIIFGDLNRKSVIVSVGVKVEIAILSRAYSFVVFEKINKLIGIIKTCQLGDLLHRIGGSQQIILNQLYFTLVYILF